MGLMGNSAPRRLGNPELLCLIARLPDCLSAAWLR